MEDPEFFDVQAAFEAVDHFERFASSGTMTSEFADYARTLRRLLNKCIELSQLPREDEARCGECAAADLDPGTSYCSRCGNSL